MPSQYDQLKIGGRRRRYARARAWLSFRRAAIVGAVLGLVMAGLDVLDRLLPALQPRRPLSGPTMLRAVIIEPVVGAILAVALVALGRVLLAGWRVFVVREPAG